MRNKQQHSRVELEESSLGQNTEWNVLQDPAAADPEADQSDNAERGRGRQTLEVLRLSAGVFGHAAGGDVEAGEAEKTAEGEEGEQEVVEGGAHANGEGCCGGGDGEGDLEGSVLVGGSFWVGRVEVKLPSLRVNLALGP